MPLSNLASATAEQKANVARLMFHCGIATEADYGIDGTGAIVSNAEHGMTNFFGFSSSMQLLIKSAFTTAQWEQILRDELDQGYPCFYSGDGNEGGHMFICEGYTSDNKYTMNWGWGGQFNGDFSLSALSPQNTYNFNSSQQMVVNIRHTGSLGPSSLIGLVSGTSSSPQYTGLELMRGGSVLSDKIVTVGQTYDALWIRWMRLMTYSPFSGRIGVALYDPARNFKELLREYTLTTPYQPDLIYSLSFSNFKVTSANTGDIVRAVYSTDNGATWNAIHGGGYGVDDSLIVIGVGGSTPVSSVTLSPTTKDLKIGETVQLQATIKPDNATIKTVSWSSNNTSIATVSNSGLVTAKASGIAVITVTTTNGAKTATCNVTVKSNNANLSAITLSAGTLSPTFNASTTSYSVTVPYETTAISVTGTPAHQSATVSGNVTNKALNVGANTISLVVTAEDGDTDKTYTITVTRQQQTIAVSGVTLSQTEATLNINQTLQLQATVAPENATNKTVTWSSGNTAVATVNSSSGLVTAKAAGTAVITVTTADGSKKATCSVYVRSNNANLSAITLPYGIALSPSFIATTINYTVSVPYETETISVTGVPAHQNATVSGNVTDKQLNVGANNTVSLVVTAEDGVTKKTYTITITRQQQLIPVSEVIISPTAATLNAGQSLDIQHTVLPQDATNKAVSWYSDNPTIAAVDSYGRVTAKISGTATITVSTVDGAKQARCNITVITPVSGINLDVSSTKLDMGKSLKLIATVQPVNADNQLVDWTSDNPAVATVDKDGLVFGKAEGVAVITATTQDGSYKASCVIDVVDRTASQPASDFLTVKTLNGAVHIDASQTIENVAVYNVAGVILYQQQSKTNSIILDQLPAKQILIIKIRLAGGKVAVRKLII
jgi:uncharacterized protein YjdB